MSEKKQEPLHVTFAREVLGHPINEIVPVYRWDWDRAYCQELAEINHLYVSWAYSRWVAGGKEDSVLWSKTGESWCEAVLRWAIAAKRAGVDVKVPR